MGAIQSSISQTMKATMQDQMDKQMEFQNQAFKMQMERQLVMQNEMRERMMAAQLARAREIFKYYSVFYSLVLTGGLIGAMKKKPAAMIPSVPLGFVMAFQYDAAYGTMMARVRAEAERILGEEHDRLSIPTGMPTFDGIEAKRLG